LRTSRLRANLSLYPIFFCLVIAITLLCFNTTPKMSHSNPVLEDDEHSTTCERRRNVTYHPHAECPLVSPVWSSLCIVVGTTLSPLNRAHPPHSSVPLGSPLSLPSGDFYSWPAILFDVDLGGWLRSPTFFWKLSPFPLLAVCDHAGSPTVPRRPCDFFLK